MKAKNVKLGLVVAIKNGKAGHISRDGESLFQVVSPLDAGFEAHQDNPAVDRDGDVWVREYIYPELVFAPRCVSVLDIRRAA